MSDSLIKDLLDGYNNAFEEAIQSEMVRLIQKGDIVVYHHQGRLIFSKDKSVATVEGGIRLEVSREKFEKKK